MAESFLCIRKPKRCLTAYNLFFHHERQKLLDALKNNAAGEGDNDSNEPKKSKSIGFAPMAQTISAKWRVITDEDREHFNALAKQDRMRYDKEMEEWRAKQARLEQLLQEAPEVALAALQSSAAEKSTKKRARRKPAASRPKKKLKEPPTLAEDADRTKPKAITQPPATLMSSKHQGASVNGSSTFLNLPKTTTVNNPNNNNGNASFTVPRMVSNNELPQARLARGYQKQVSQVANNLFPHNQSYANETFSVPRQVSVQELNQTSAVSQMQMQTNPNLGSQANGTFLLSQQNNVPSQLVAFQQQMLFGNNNNDSPSTFNRMFEVPTGQDMAGCFNGRNSTVPSFQDQQLLGNDSMRSTLDHTCRQSTSCHANGQAFFNEVNWNSQNNQACLQDLVRQTGQQSFLAAPNHQAYGNNDYANQQMNQNDFNSVLGQQQQQTLGIMGTSGATSLSTSAATNANNGRFEFPCFASYYGSTGNHEDNNTGI